MHACDLHQIFDYTTKRSRFRLSEIYSEWKLIIYKRYVHCHARESFHTNCLNKMQILSKKPHWSTVAKISISVDLKMQGRWLLWPATETTVRTISALLPIRQYSHSETHICFLLSSSMQLFWISTSSYSGLKLNSTFSRHE